MGSTGGSAEDSRAMCPATWSRRSRSMTNEWPENFLRSVHFSQLFSLLESRMVSRWLVGLLVSLMVGQHLQFILMVALNYRTIKAIFAMSTWRKVNRFLLVQYQKQILTRLNLRINIFKYLLNIIHNLFFVGQYWPVLNIKSKTFLLIFLMFHEV